MRTTIKEEGLGRGSKKEYKAKIRDSALHLSKIMDFFECAKLALQDAAYGKDPYTDYRKDRTEEEREEAMELKIALRSVDQHREELAEIFTRLLELDKTFEQYSATVLNERIKTMSENVSRMVETTRDSTQVTLIPTATKATPTPASRKIWATLGAIMMLSSEAPKPVLNLHKAMIEVSEQMAASELVMTAEPQFVPASSAVAHKSGHLTKDQLDWIGSAGDIVKAGGKKLMDGKSTAKVRWVCYIPMRKVTSGNLVRKYFNITQKRMRFKVGGWSLTYE